MAALRSQNYTADVAEAIADALTEIEELINSIQSTSTDDLDIRITLLENAVYDNEISAALATEDEDVTLLTDDEGYAVMADWKYQIL